MQREDREKRVSAARRRAEQHATGYETTVLRVPEGVGFFDFKEGTHLIDVIPYLVKKGKDVQGGNPFAETGELYYERTFFTYRSIGVEEKSYVCPSKTFGEPDYIQEYRQKESKNPAADADHLKSLNPKERQIFLIYDRKETEKGIQVLEVSFHLFGKLLDSRIKNSSDEDGWDRFYFPGDDGMTLRLTVEEKSAGGYKFSEATAIDFLRRKEPIPKKILDHRIDLDEMPIEIPYEKLKSIFLGVTDGQKMEDQENSKRVESAAKKEGTKKEVKVTTATDLGLKSRDSVLFKGRRHEIVKISPDGTSLTLLDENDEVVRAVGLDEVKPYSESAPFDVANEKAKPAGKGAVKEKEIESKDEDKWDDDWK